MDMAGVEGVAMEVDRGTMTVVGRFDAKKLRDRVANKTRKNVDLVGGGGGNNKQGGGGNQHKGADEEDGKRADKGGDHEGKEKDKGHDRQEEEGKGKQDEKQGGGGSGGGGGKGKGGGKDNKKPVVVRAYYTPPHLNHSTPRMMN